MTYNGQLVPETVKPGRILSAFCNPIDYDRVRLYASVMQERMLSHPFPPIQGFPSKIDENDIGKFFMTGEEVTEEHIGEMAWMVTDGHHRATAAVFADLPWLRVELDYTTITMESEIKQRRK